MGKNKDLEFITFYQRFIKLLLIIMKGNIWWVMGK